MILDLKRLFIGDEQIINIDEWFNFSEDGPSDLPILSRPVFVKGEIRNDLGIVTASATIATDFDTVCDRCVEDVNVPIQLETYHTLVQKLEQEDEDDGTYLVLRDMKLDIERLVHDDIILLAPNKFLCDNDCKGLCSTCGKNLNNDICTCEKEVDPRLAILQELL